METNIPLMEVPPLIVIADDNKDDRISVEQHFKKIDPGYPVFHFPTPEELDYISAGIQHIIFILDIRFDNNRYLLNKLLDKIEVKWPDSIRIVLSNFTGDITDNDKARIDFLFAKLNFTINPELINDIILEAIIKRKEQGKWERLNLNNKTIIMTLNGYVNGISYPNIEATIEEISNDTKTYRKILLPYDIFSAVNILGEDMRFKYILYQEYNRIVSEILPPDDDIIYDDVDLPKHLKALKDLQESKLKSNSQNETGNL